MAISNNELVGRILNTLGAGLGPAVLRAYREAYGERYLQEIELALQSHSYDAPHLPTPQRALNSLDTLAWLNLMSRRWNDVFRHALSRSERAWVNELQDARNRHAHATPDSAFSSVETRRAAETARLLLEALGAADEAQAVSKVEQILLHRLYEQDVERGRRARARQEQRERTTTSGLAPWRLVVTPHRDVEHGEFRKAEFALDLAQVLRGDAEPEYGDPREFFRRTYVTEGLRELLVNGINRLNGVGADPVVQLQTSFGGGKTHSMLALWHLMGGGVGIRELPESEAILRRVGDVDDRIEARRAAVVGTAFSATKPRVRDGCTTRTIWGDLAWQLGGLEGYALLQRDDEAGLNPGSETLLDLLETHGPALIVIDELVAFARPLYGKQDLHCSFDTLMSFIQSLTEALRRSSDSLLLVSIPESEREAGGEGGREVLERLTHTIGRIDSVWKPVAALESYEIVRRRLFTPEVKVTARDAVLKAFGAMYRKAARDYPGEVSESDYLERMRASYPVHPELFQRLYEDWSTLERFQRTRGVLRMMASVIHSLWAGNDQSLLIMPGSVPLDDVAVRDEMLRYLPENWSAIVDGDVDGGASRPYQLDVNVSALGKYMAGRRVARSVFIGSAPTERSQRVRGLDESRIRLGTLQPGESAGAFNDALRRMSNELAHLYADGNRYWYDTRPTVNRMARERAQQIPDAELHQEALKRLKAIDCPRGAFPLHQVAPGSSADVADEQRVRIVLLGPQHGHRSRDADSAAMREARGLLETRGNGPRYHRNMLVFLAPDETGKRAWLEALREVLAWRGIRRDIDNLVLNLDMHQINQVDNALAKARQTLEGRLTEAWRWLLTPTQGEASEALEIEAQRLNVRGNLYEEAAQRLEHDGLLVKVLSPDVLLMELDKTLWPADRPHLGLRQLRDYLTQYCYLPRLRDSTVLAATIREGVSRAQPAFGYATRAREDGEYDGLVFREDVKVYFDDNDVIVRREIAESLIVPPEPAPYPVSPTPLPETPIPTHPPAPPQKLANYLGRVRLEPLRAQSTMRTVVEEVLEHLSSQAGAKVELELSIRARRSGGFDESVVRNVRENGTSLGFSENSFD